MNTTTLNLEAGRTMTRLGRKTTFGLTADIGAKVDEKFVTVCTEHLTLIGRPTLTVARKTLNPDFCDICKADFPNWFNADLDAAMSKVRGSGSSAHTDTESIAKAVHEALTPEVVAKVEKKVAAAKAKAAKTLPVTSKAKSPRKPAAKAPAKRVRGKAVATETETVEVPGTSITAKRVLAPKGAKAPYSVRDGKVTKEVPNWTAAKSFASQEPTPANIFDATGVEVAHWDGKEFTTFEVVRPEVIEVDLTNSEH